MASIDLLCTPSYTMSQDLFVLGAGATAVAVGAHLAAMAKRRAAAKSPLAQRVLEARLRAGMKQRELAAASGVSRPTIANIERGTNLTVQVETAVKLAGALGVSVDYIAGAGACRASAIVESFLRSDYGRDANATPEEQEWLRSLTEIAWLGREPTEKTIYLMLEALRATKTK